PFGAAMVHEFALLLPALLLEKHRRLVAVLAEVKADLASDPLFRAFDHLPNHAFGRLKFEDLHLEKAACAEMKFDHAAQVWAASRVVGPPSGQALKRGEGAVHVLG